MKSKLLYALMLALFISCNTEGTALNMSEQKRVKRF